MHGKGITIVTPLLKWYLENSLVVDDIQFIIQYNPKTCFNWFTDHVFDERRAGYIRGPEQKIIVKVLNKWEIMLTAVFKLFQKYNQHIQIPTS